MHFEQPQPIGAYLRSPARLLLVLLFLSAFEGCASTPSTTISTDASGIATPSLSVAFDLGDSKQPASEPHSGHAIEIEAGKARGGGYQTLAPGQPPVIINNTTFNSPKQLRNDFVFNFGGVSYRWRKFFGERQVAGLELTGGIGYTSLGLTVTSPTQQDSGRFGNTMAKGSFAFIWRMRPSTSLHLRLTTFRLPNAFAADGINSADRSEIFLSQAIGDNVALWAGYTSWVVDGSAGFGRSDFHTTFDGPMVNLGLNF